MHIIGAGMAGLLCGALNPSSQIYESGPETALHHQALLRMRTDEISRMTGISFKKVFVSKSIWFDKKEYNPSPRLANLYSRKVIGVTSSRSISNIDSCIRYIPPADFIGQLQKLNKGRISYNTKIGPEIFGDTFKTEPIISTIPLPVLIRLVNTFAKPIKSIDSPEFLYRKIVVNKFKVSDCDSYCTVYYPAPNCPVYRATLDSNILTVESIVEVDITKNYLLPSICVSLGLSEDSIIKQLVFNHTQLYGKILEINNKLRENLITNLTLNHGIYSLGRFSTWRPKVLLDDVLNDIFVIRNLIKGGNYSAMNYNQNS